MSQAYQSRYAAPRPSIGGSGSVWSVLFIWGTPCDCSRIAGPMAPGSGRGSGFPGIGSRVDNPGRPHYDTETRFHFTDSGET